MILDIRTLDVQDAFLGPETAFADGVLTISTTELEKLLIQERDQFESVAISLAKPGEERRIIHILDAIEPRTKMGGNASAYPGFLGPPERVGTGVTYRLAGLTVLTCAEFPEYDPDSMMGANEGLIDMTGPGAALSPFGKTINVALAFKPKRGARADGFSNAIRMAGFKVATCLAETAKNAVPVTETQYGLDVCDCPTSLPRVAAVYLLSSLSLPLRESFIYGHPVGGVLPTILHPNEMLDGAVVSNYFIYGGVRNPTYFYQNNPVLHELYEQHGKELNLAGVILTRAGAASDTGKLNQAATAAEIAKLMRVKGAVISANAGGQQVVDFMSVCQQFERRAIKTVGIVAEMADIDGTDFGFPTCVPEADALISVGNREELVDLPAMEVVIGGEKLQDGQGWAGAQLRVPLRHIFCSATQLGAWNVSAEDF